MRKNLPVTKSFLLVLGIVAFAHFSFAQVQSVTATSGAYLQGQKFAVSFTLGETVITTLEKPTIRITQGFQQTNLLVTAVDELNSLAIKIEAYPNPVKDNMSLVLSEMLPGETSYALYNSIGGLIVREKLDALVTNISFQSLVPAVYILKVTQGTTSIKTFKIVKN